MNKIAKFSTLALGTRFKYMNHDRLYVKLSHNTVAEWNDAQIDTSWIGQGIFSAWEKDNEDFEVVIIM